MADACTPNVLAGQLSSATCSELRAALPYTVALPMAVVMSSSTKSVCCTWKTLLRGCSTTNNCEFLPLRVKEGVCAGVPPTTLVALTLPVTDTPQSLTCRW